MEALLRRDHDPDCTLKKALRLGLDAWSAGSLPPPEEDSADLPAPDALAQHRAEALQSATIEAGVLERTGRSAIRYRAITGEELKGMTAA